jgi:hypothetical protein
VGGVTPPKKSKKGGPNLRGGGPGMLELQNVLKMNDFFAENVLRKISGTFVFEKITSTTPKQLPTAGSMHILPT